MIMESTPLQAFFQSNPQLCPPDFRFSVEKLKKTCDDFTDTDPFYKTSCLFIDLFDELRRRLFELDIFRYEFNALVEGSIALTNADAIAAYRAQINQLRRNITTRQLHWISALSERGIVTSAGARLNLDESFPALADTLQTVLDAITNLARGTGNVGENRSDFEERLLNFGMLSNAYRIFKDDWERALWQNFIFKEHERTLEQPEMPLTRALRANYIRYQDYEFRLRTQVRRRIATLGSQGLYEATLGDVTKLPAIKALLRVFGNVKLGNSITLNDAFRFFLHLRTVAEKLLETEETADDLLGRAAIPQSKLISEMANTLHLSKSQLSEALRMMT